MVTALCATATCEGNSGNRSRPSGAHTLHCPFSTPTPPLEPDLPRVPQRPRPRRGLPAVHQPRVGRDGDAACAFCPPTSEEGVQNVNSNALRGDAGTQVRVEVGPWVAQVGQPRRSRGSVCPARTGPLEGPDFPRKMDTCPIWLVVWSESRLRDKIVPN